jgi:hypothetical protein
MPLLFANLFSTMRASLRRRLNDEFDDGVAYDRQAWLHSFLWALKRGTHHIDLTEFREKAKRLTGAQSSMGRLLFD